MKAFTLLCSFIAALNYAKNYFGVRTASTLLITIFLSSCSVGMALSGKEDPNLGAVRVGASRGEVELQLSSPITSVSLNDGSRTDIYEYEIGNKPSAGRAIGHGVMDVLTLGAWEIIGTPVEGLTGNKRRISITYNKDDIVTKITGTGPERSL